MMLDAIGRELGVSRERVRQLEARALTYVHENAHELAEGIRSLLAMYALRSEPIYLDLLSAEIPAFAGFEDRLPFLGKLIERLTRDELHCWAFDGRLILTRVTEEVWDVLTRQAKTALRQQLSAMLTRSDVRLFVLSIASSANAHELGGALYDVIEPELQFGSSESNASFDEQVLVGLGTSAKTLVRVALEQSESPLVLREVIARCAARGGETASPQTYINALRVSGAHVFSGRRYGLDKHLPISVDSLRTLAAAAERVVAAGPDGRQWHCSELVEALEEELAEVPDALDSHLVNIALRKYGRLVDLGRLVWQSGSASRFSAEARRDIADLCLAALKLEGRPLTTEEMAARIESVRGLHDQFLPQPSAHMARLAPGLWGLVERDFGISEQQQAEILDRFAAKLRQRGRGVHHSEIVALIPEVADHPLLRSGFPLIGLAQRDTRFRVGRGWLVGLSTWGDVRRLTFGAAVRKATSQLERFESVSAVHAFIEAATERRFSLWQVKSALAEEGLEFTTGLGWVRTTDEE